MLFLHTITLRALIHSWLHVHICVRQKVEKQELRKVLILYKANLDLCKTKENGAGFLRLVIDTLDVFLHLDCPLRLWAHSRRCHYLSLATENFLLLHWLWAEKAQVASASWSGLCLWLVNMGLKRHGSFVPIWDNFEIHPASEFL